MNDCFGFGMTEEEIVRWDNLWVDLVASNPSIYKSATIANNAAGVFCNPNNAIFLDRGDVEGNKVMGVSVCSFGLPTMLSHISDYCHVFVSRLATVMARGLFCGVSSKPVFLHAADDCRVINGMRGELDVVLTRHFMLHQACARTSLVMDFVGEMLKLGGKAVFDFLGDGIDAPSQCDGGYGRDWRIFKQSRQSLMAMFAQSPLSIVEEIDQSEPLPRKYIIVEKV